MTDLNHSLLKYFCIILIVSAAWSFAGCDSSSSSVFSQLAQEGTITGSVAVKNSASGIQSMSRCRVWVEGYYNNGVTADDRGNFRLVAPSGNHRIIAQMKDPSGSYVGRSMPVTVSGQTQSSALPKVYLEKGTESCSFKLKDSSGRLLNNQDVRATLWDIPAQYDYRNNCFITPLMPAGLRPASSVHDNSGLAIAVSGGGYRDTIIPIDLNAGPTQFEHTLSRMGETSFAPQITSVSSTQDEKPINTDFIHNGLNELRLRVCFSANGGEIATWSWNDGGIGHFIGINGDRSNTFCDIVWEPQKKDSVGTLTFNLIGKNGLSSGVNISINESLMKDGSGTPDSYEPQQPSAPIAISFSGLNELSNGVIYNPGVLYNTESDAQFKIKLHISGISDKNMLKNGSFSQALQVTGAEVVSDDSHEESLSERIYTLKRPDSFGTHSITAVLTDKYGIQYRESYNLRVAEPASQGNLTLEKISVDPIGNMFTKDKPISFSAYAYTDNSSTALWFKWYVNNQLVSEQKKDIISCKKFSSFTWNSSSAVPLNTSLSNGKYIIKCVVSSIKSEQEQELPIIVSDPIDISFAPREEGSSFNPLYREASSWSAAKFKVLIHNRSESQIKSCIWEISRKNGVYKPVSEYEEESSLEYGNLRSSENVKKSGNSSLAYIVYVPGDDMEIPGSYTVRVTVTDENGRIDKAVSEEFYSDGDPYLEQLKVTQRYRKSKYEVFVPAPAPSSLRAGIMRLPVKNQDVSLVINTSVTDGDPSDPIEFYWEVSVPRDDGHGEVILLKIYEEKRIIDDGQDVKNYDLCVPWEFVRYGEGCLVKCTIKDKLYGRYEHTNYVGLVAGYEDEYYYGSGDDFIPDNEPQ